MEFQGNGQLDILCLSHFFLCAHFSSPSKATFALASLYILILWLTWNSKAKVDLVC